jgi:large subunit ribosomal protein L1
MAKKDLDPSELHDPLEQNLDENTAEEMVMEHILDAGEVTAAEESAMHTDNEVALEATHETVAKKKNTESTGEKAKRAAAERAAKGLSAEPVSVKKLDPLRLRGKKYRVVAAKVDKNKVYSLEDGITLVKEVSTSKFDGSLELHIKVKGEAVRGTVVLPHGTGKTKKVAVADEETIEAIAAGKLDFDVLLATPAQMPKLAKYAKLLGPKGLMPSPKAGTVTDDIEKVKGEISGGRVEYRADKTGVIHLGIGRLSFTTAQLVENFQTIETALGNTKVVTVSLAPTMGPGLKVQFAK